MSQQEEGFIQFPLEFLVEGTPVSSQSDNGKAREAWKECVEAACRVAIGDNYWISDRRLSITIFYFPPTPMQGDIDNIVKLIQDALIGVVYHDDQRIERAVVQKFEPDTVVKIEEPSEVLIDAMQKERPIVYIRVADVPEEVTV